MSLLCALKNLEVCLVWGNVNGVGGKGLESCPFWTHFKAWILEYVAASDPGPYPLLKSPFSFAPLAPSHIWYAPHFSLLHPQLIASLSFVPLMSCCRTPSSV